jgi:hypothetical protein
MMPRRQTTVEREVPLFLIPHMIMKRIRQHEEAMERIIVRKTRRHFYNISIRTRPVKRECRQESQKKIAVDRIFRQISGDTSGDTK